MHVGLWLTQATKVDAVALYNVRTAVPLSMSRLGLRQHTHTSLPQHPHSATHTRTFVVHSSRLNEICCSTAFLWRSPASMVLPNSRSLVVTCNHMMICVFVWTADQTCVWKEEAGGKGSCAFEWGGFCRHCVLQECTLFNQHTNPCALCTQALPTHHAGRCPNRHAHTVRKTHLAVHLSLACWVLREGVAVGTERLTDLVVVGVVCRHTAAAATTGQQHCNVEEVKRQRQYSERQTTSTPCRENKRPETNARACLDTPSPS